MKSVTYETFSTRLYVTREGDAYNALFFLSRSHSWQGLILWANGTIMATSLAISYSRTKESLRLRTNVFDFVQHIVIFHILSGLIQRENKLYIGSPFTNIVQF